MTVQGPGHLEGEDRDDWLFLAKLSADECKDVHAAVTNRLTELSVAVDCYNNFDGKQRQDAIEAMEEEICDLPFTEENIQGVNTRVYTSDLGFAAAYWNGHEHAAVRDADGLLFVGSKRLILSRVGITPDKVLSPTFGIIFPKG